MPNEDLAFFKEVWVSEMRSVIPIWASRGSLVKGSSFGFYFDETFSDFDLELIPSPAMAACSGTTGIYGKSTVTFIPESRPAEIPAFDAYCLDNFNGGQGLSIQLVKMEYRTATEKGTIKVDDLSGMKNLSFKMFDTAVAMAITE
ncbi:MAG: hypothetical protein II047_13180, partial [Bacteroidales bacterium]|nr:hypothetical protein [Bacteroidales bacterium]